MFCHKCGAEIADGSAFCHKCGAQVVDADKSRAIPGGAQTDTGEGKRNDFKEFVDNHVRKNTKFQSAEELLNSRVSLGFVRLCFGIPLFLTCLSSILVLISSASIIDTLVCFLSVGMFLFLLGYAVAIFVGFVKKNSYVSRFSNKFAGNIDTDDLIRFLDVQLSYLRPHFHEWGYVTSEGLNVRGSLEAAMVNSVTNSFKEVRVGTEFGKEKWRIVQINIRPDLAQNNSGLMVYAVIAKNRVDGMPLISHDWGFAKYTSVVRSAPILQAAMEYYLKIYSNGESKDELITNNIAQPVVVEIPAEPVQQAQPPQQHVVPMNMPKKGKSVKLPIMIGVVVLAIAIVAIAVNIGKNQQSQSSANSEDVNLSETYINDIAGISFDYPDGWVILDTPSEFEIIKMIDSKNNADSIAQFEVTYILDIDPLGVFTGNEASVRENVSEFASFLGFWDTTIDDIPVKSVMYQIQGLAGDSVVKRYYYIIEDDIYQITYSYSVSTANTYEPIFDAIIDSYTIKVPIASSNIDAQSISDESIIYSLDYRGYALAELLGSRREELDDIYGMPTGGTLVDGYLMYGGTEYHEYNDGEMYAIMNEENETVMEISVMANAAKLNGDAMDLTREEIKKLFGEPSYEDVDYDEYGEEYGYVVEYYPIEGKFYLSFWFPDINTEAYDITISRYSEY